MVRLSDFLSGYLYRITMQELLRGLHVGGDSWFPFTLSHGYLLRLCGMITS